MSKKRLITAIFKRNLIFNEIKKLLIKDGFEISNKINFNSLKKKDLDKSILIIEIMNEKNAVEFALFDKKHNYRKYILCILNKNVQLSGHFENLKIMSQPFAFNELLKNLNILEKSPIDSTNSVRLANLLYYPNRSKFVNNTNGRDIKLTDLENKLVSYVIGKDKGCSKSEILQNVWRHKTSLDTHTMESLIYRLRRKIENDPNKPEILVQIKNKYFLISS